MLYQTKFMHDFVLPRRLPYRKTSLDKFSTFVEMNSYKQGFHFSWKVQQNLQRNIKQIQQKDRVFEDQFAKGNEKYILQYFLNFWQTQTLPRSEQRQSRDHILAYLQAPSYNAAIFRFNRFKDKEQLLESWLYYLKLADEITHDPNLIDKLLKKHKESENLENYFKVEIASQVRDLFYSTRKRGKYSRWYTLKETSRLRLSKVLLEWGVEAKNIPQYLLARDCFFEFHAKINNRWLEPSEENYKNATQLFNEQYQPSPNTPEKSIQNPISVPTFKKYIQDCLKALEKYFKGIEKFVQFENEQEIENFSQPFASEILADDPLTTFESIEQVQQHRDSLLTYLSEQLQNLPLDHQLMLLLRYGFELSEPQMKKQLGVNQSTINRRTKRCHKQLLESVGQWIKTTQIQCNLHLLTELEETVILWLKHYYKTQVELGLITAFKTLKLDVQQLLVFQYVQQLEVKEIAQKLNLSEREIKKKINMAIEDLLEKLLLWSQQTLNLSLESEQKKLVKLIENFLNQVSLYKIYQL